MSNVNTVTFNHPGGNLRLGIANTGGRFDEWTAFDNFKLVGPEGEIALENGDFSEGLNVDKNQDIWNCANINMSNNAPTQYWNPFRDFTVEKYVGGDNTGVNDIISDDENAPVEYFNLQGVRVANPENGVFIVKQGKKVSKVVLK